MFNKNKGLPKIQALLAVLVVVIATLVPSTTVKAAPVEVPQPALGIDVSYYQGLINWDMVAASGVKFAMIRVGYRAQATGILTEDLYARYNLQEANRVGIKAGAYFFSTAISVEEVVEEAVWTCNLLDSYQITYPVVYDCEGFEKQTSRQFGLDKNFRTALATIFLDNVASRGYIPMFYSAKNSMENNKSWDMNILASKYKVWVASYPAVTFPAVPCNYTGIHSMWQYTDKGTIAGINGAVDMNVSYFDYTETAQAKNGLPVGTSITSENAANVQYTPVVEVVTTNTVVNLRTEPGTDRNDTIVGKLSNGDMIWRVGIGNNGWSMVKLPDSEVIYYAYTKYLSKVQ